jgi:hypothetical protein
LPTLVFTAFAAFSALSALALSAFLGAMLRATGTDRAFPLEPGGWDDFISKTGGST